VGGSVGATFVFNEIPYTTTSFWDDPNGSDLRIWKVDGLFPIWAPVYSLNDEAGKPMVVLGRGTQRGDPVIISVVETNYTTNFVQSSSTTLVTNTVLSTNYTTKAYKLKSLHLTPKQARKLYPTATIKEDKLILLVGTITTNETVTLVPVVTNIPVVTSEVVTNLELKGWKAGPGDGVMRWGENQVSGAGAYLVAAFDFAAGDNEATLSSGDSSGAVFIQEGGVWKLAGINYGIEGPFRVSATDPSFYGAILDKSGLYQQPPVDGFLRPACFFATRISTRLSWITTILNQ
jgi:hypothetical protein